MKKILIVLFIFSTRAHCAGTSAAEFLVLDLGARSSAMGGAYTAVSDDSLAVNYNPAGLAWVSRKELSFSYARWLEEITCQQAAYVQTLGEKFTLAVQAGRVSSGDMEKIDDDGNSLGSSYDYTALQAGGSLAVKLLDSFSLGASAKFVREDLDGHDAGAAAFDAGLMLRFRYFNLGASASNIGGELKLYQESFKLPSVYRAGAAVKPFEKLLVSADAVRNRDSDVVRPAFGAEYRWNGEGDIGAMFLRAGYQSKRDKNAGEGFSFGAGLEYKTNYELGYAYVPYGDFGGTHRLTFAFRFGSERGVREEETEPSAEPASAGAGKPSSQNRQAEIEKAAADLKSGKITAGEFRKLLRDLSE